MENSFLNDDSAIDSPKISQEKALEAYDISLLEEKLVVRRSKQKVGEVVVRKEIETRMIHLPIRREKLIVEKAGVTPEHITEVDLGEGEVNGVGFNELGNTDNIYQVQSRFVTLAAAQELLAEIAENRAEGNSKIRLEIITDSSKSQQVYQDACDRGGYALGDLN